METDSSDVDGPTKSGLTNLQGQQIAGWTLGTLLGKGSFGAVYHAQKGTVQAAMKIEKENEYSCVGRELRMLVKLNGGTVDAVGRRPKIEYIVMELLDETAETVAARGELKDAVLTALLVDVLGALRTIHADETVYGDVKPRNIMRRLGGRWALVDFGSSFVETSRDRIMPFNGTPAFGADRALTHGGLRRWDDLESLAYVGYACLNSMRVPWQSALTRAGRKNAKKKQQERLRMIELRNAELRSFEASAGDPLSREIVAFLAAVRAGQGSGKPPPSTFYDHWLRAFSALRFEPVLPTMRMPRPRRSGVLARLGIYSRRVRRSVSAGQTAVRKSSINR